MGVKQKTEGLVRAGSLSLGVPLDDMVIPGMVLFILELERWNRKINLIARRTPPAEIVDKHILDSLTLLPFFNRQGISLVDIGSGAGFPGLPIAIARPDIQVILVEPRVKRVSFLKHIVRSLKLANVLVMETRFTGIEPFTGKGIDFITSRAVTEPEKFLEMVKPLLKRETEALLMLGPEKRDLWRENSPLPGLRIAKALDFVLPVSKGQRTVCRVQMDR